MASNSLERTLHERKTAEAQLHDSDVMYGTPFDIGEGYSVAFHSATCRYCSIRLKAWDMMIFFNGKGNMGGNEAI